MGERTSAMPDAARAAAPCARVGACAVLAFAAWASPRRAQAAGGRQRRLRHQVPRRLHRQRRRLGGRRREHHLALPRGARSGTASSASSRCGRATTPTATASTRCPTSRPPRPPGAPADVSVSETSSGSSVRIRVGSPDETVSRHPELRGALPPRVDRQRLRRRTRSSTTTSSTPVTTARYDDVSASVTGPQPSDRAECFRGELGSTDRCEAIPGRHRPVQHAVGGLRARGSRS